MTVLLKSTSQTHSMYYYTDEVEMDVAYSVESNGLKLNDILYTKDDDSAKTTAAVTEAATETATTSAK